MITIHELTSLKEAANYYKVKDEYYSDNPNSRWFGKGAQLMGLKGEVYKSTFEQLLSGRNHKGEVVVKPGVNGEHRLGYDITFGAPKSLSIMLDVLGDERLLLAHKKAVDFTLDYLETMYAQARITLNGKTESVNTGNLIIATFDENTNRALEPHRHTHAIILNMTQRKDGKWRALTNEQLYRQYMFLGQIYRS